MGELHLTGERDDAASVPFPLTDIQEAYWVGRNMALELGNVAPQRWIEIEGRELDIDRVVAAFRRLIDRHDMLRAIIRPDGQQQILRHVPPYEVDVLDLRQEPPEVACERLDDVRRLVSEEQFVTDRWPLFSLRATRLGDHHYRLHFNFDMLLVDLMSFQIMFRDLALLYEGRDHELPPLDFGFREYIATIGSLRATAAYRKAKDHWWKRLPTLPGMPELPLEAPLGAVGAPRFQTRVVSVEPKAWAGIKERGAEAGLTPSTVALTAFCEVVGTWSAKSRFGLMMTAFNRRPVHPTVNAILGDFTSTILLDVDCVPRDSFETRARRLQHRVWVGFRHGQVSGIEVLREMNRRNGTPVRAAAPVIFNSTLQDLAEDLPPPSALEGPLPVDDAILADPAAGERWRRERRIGALGDVVYSAGQAPQILLEARASDRAGYLVIVVDSLDELFPKGLVDDVARALGELLMDLSEHEDSWRRPRHRLVPRSQLDQRDAINAAARRTVPSVALPTLVAGRPGRGDDLAVAWPGGGMTFGHLDERAEGVAARLTPRILPNDLVAVVMERGWEQVVAVLGVARAGAAYVPIDADLPPDRMRHLLRDSQASIALSQRRVIDRLDTDQNLEWLAVDDAAPQPRPAISRHPPVDDLAYVIYTSGSTGRPKGVMVTHGAAANTIVDINGRFRVGPDDRILSVSSLSFDLSVYDIFGLLAAGGAVVLVDPDRSHDPAHWLQLMARENVTIWNSVPSLMEILVEYVERHRAESVPLRLVMLSGDRIPLDLPERVRAVFPGADVVSLGGATEASIWSTYYRIGSIPSSWKRIPYGRPLTNQSLHVLDEALDPCPSWVTGQLYIGGDGLARGYWGDPEKTAASFLRHPSTGERLYRTGDMCRYLPDGNLDILGREDFQVKIRGSRIELGEIEVTLMRHADVREAVTVVQGERSIDKRLIAYVVLQPSSTFDPADLHAFLRAKLPGYMVPSSYVRIPAVPRNPNGKIAYAALPNPSGPESARKGQEMPEENHSAARKIAAVIQAVLGTDDLGSQDVSLLELGATSIDYLRILNRMEEELRFRPDLDQLLDRPTLSNLTTLYCSWLSRTRDHGRAAREEKLSQQL